MAFTALTWTKLTSSQSSISVTIPSGYQDLIIKCSLRGDRSSEDFLGMRVNGVSSSSYNWGNSYSDGNTPAVSQGATTGISADTLMRIGYLPASSVASNNFYTARIHCYSYLDTNVTKSFRWIGGYENSVTSGDVKTQHGGGMFNSTSNITSISFHPVFGSNFVAGSTVAVYGYTRA
jgi:hypothetical protein